MSWIVDDWWNWIVNNYWEHRDVDDWKKYYDERRYDCYYFGGDYYCGCGRKRFVD